MKYFVVTTKHHEGFCLWDSKLTDYKAPNTPAGRDLLRPMVEAFRRENLRVGFYHSLIDWHHPQYVIDPHIGPYRDSPDREQDEQRPRPDEVRRLSARPGRANCSPSSARSTSCGSTFYQLPTKPARLTRAKAARTGRARSSTKWSASSSRRSCWTTAWTFRTAGTSRRPSSSSRGNGSRWTASRWCGRPARPSRLVGLSPRRGVPGAAPRS